ncbi:MAG: SH3 domain-containing protein [Prevotella sp.]|nr:SH3 domain-containing protein [Prevotella sp.]
MKQSTKNHLLPSILLWALSIILLTTSCSSPSDIKYTPQIIDRDSVLSLTLKNVFTNVDYPAGLVPVMVLENTIDDPIKTSAHADDIFDEISEARESDNFEDYGLLVYITREPKLVQLRIGDHYDSFSDLCGVLSGKNYLELQQQFADGNFLALGELLKATCKNVEERNNLSWWQRGQLSGISVAISNAMGWFGSPSKNFYGTFVAKPVYMCISYGNKILGSWIWGIMLVFAIIYIARWLISKVFQIIIPSIRLRNTLTGLFGAIIGAIYSFSAAGCSMYFSSGRMEDLYAIKAFGIPNVESFISDPTMFVHESNYWLAGLFVFLTIFAISLGTLCNDTMLMAAQPIDRQMVQWNSIGKNSQDFYLNINQVSVSDIKPGETPYQAVAQKMSSNLGERLGTILGGLSIGAIFFFPKAVLWTGIAYSISKMIVKIPRIRILINSKGSKQYAGIGQLGSMMGVTLFFTVGSIVLTWLIDPFDRNVNVEPVVEQTIAPVYKIVKVTAKTANLRTGPGTEYDYATFNNGKLQVSRGSQLNVIDEENGWYKVRIGDNSQEVYIKQSLCADDINVGLYGSLSFGNNHFTGTMDGFPIEMSINKNKKTGKISGTYKNVRYKTIMKLKGETSAEQMGKITLHGSDKKSDWHFSLDGDKNHITGFAEGEEKELQIDLLPK